MVADHAKLKNSMKQVILLYCGSGSCLIPNYLQDTDPEIIIPYQDPASITKTKTPENLLILSILIDFYNVKACRL